MFKAEGNDGLILDIGDGWCTPSHVTERTSVGRDFCGGETLGLMFCGLGKFVKDIVVFS
jgi:hypothetical protein